MLWWKFISIFRYFFFTKWLRNYLTKKITITLEFQGTIHNQNFKVDKNSTVFIIMAGCCLRQTCVHSCDPLEGPKPCAENHWTKLHTRYSFHQDDALKYNSCVVSLSVEAWLNSSPSVSDLYFWHEVITNTIKSTCALTCPGLKPVVLNWQGLEETPERRISGHCRPHGPGLSSCDTVWGGRGPGLRPLLPLPPVFLLAGDGGAMCPDGGGSLRFHLHLHLPGGADHLRETGA